jgi:hypothetical protein
MHQDYDNFPREISREDGVYVARVSVGELGEAQHRFSPLSGTKISKHLSPAVPLTGI